MIPSQPLHRKSKHKKIVVFSLKRKTNLSIRSINQFSDFEISDENVLKLTPDRLIFMDIHTRSDILAIIGCDRKGTVGLVVKVNKTISRKIIITKEISL